MNDAGFEGFREARYPLDFTQRQAAGKFTSAEADDYIQRLQEQVELEADSIAPVARAKRPSATEQALSKYPDEVLAAELQRRGWIVAEGA